MTDRLIAVKYENAEPPAMRVLRVECPDEMTEWLMMGPKVFPFEDDPSLLQGEAGEQFMADHVAKCEACQRSLES